MLFNVWGGEWYFDKCWFEKFWYDFESFESVFEV